MSLDQFKQKTLGGSLGNPGSNTFIGECVSYVRQYEEQVLGISTEADGNAKDYWTNPNVLSHFDKVNNPQTGDIAVYGQTSTNPYGHIGIVYNGQLLSQNFNVPLHVSLTSLPSAKYNLLGYLRKKGTNPEEFMLDKATITNMAVKLLNRQPTQAELDQQDGKPMIDLYRAWSSSENPERANIERLTDLGIQADKDGWKPGQSSSNYKPYDGTPLYTKEG